MKKITKEELSSIRKSQEDIQNVTNLLGRLQVEYETQKASLFNSYAQHQSLFREQRESIREKYGEGTIDINTGEITQ
jgi:hypothetical protein